MEPCKSFGPPIQGGSEYIFLKFVVSNPFHVLEVGKKIKSKFSNLSPLPNVRNTSSSVTFRNIRKRFT